MADTPLSSKATATPDATSTFPFINASNQVRRSSRSDLLNEVETFSNLPAAASVNVGRIYTVLGAIVSGGATGTTWQSNGTLWRPAGGQSLLHSNTQVDGVSGGSTSEQLLSSLLLPAGLLSGVRELRIRSKWVYSATDTNARTLRIRLGSAGTSSDTEISRHTSVAGGAGLRVGNLGFSFQIVSATAVRIWAQAPLTGVWSAPDTPAGSSSAYAGDTTVTTLTDALYLSTSVQQGASPTSTASLSILSIFVE